jgi:hypothetical protein
MTFRLNTLALSLAVVATLTAPLSHAQAVRTERNMSLALATQLAADTVAACTTNGYAVTATVVDRAGSIRAVMRADNAGPHTLGASEQKAFTSASAKNATLAMMEGAQKNPAAANLVHIPGFLMSGWRRSGEESATETSSARSEWVARLVVTWTNNAPWRRWTRSRTLLK